MHVLFEGIGRIEVMRRLHERDLRVLHEPAHGRDEEVLRRHVVAVEDDDVFARSNGQSVIDVARLRVIVLIALDVAGAHLVGELPESIAAPVVENVDVKLLLRPVEIERGKDRGLDHVERLVVGRNEDVHVGPDRAVLGERTDFAVKRPADLEVAEAHHRKGIEFRAEKERRKEDVKPRIRVEGRRRAPPEVAPRNDDRNHEEQHERDARLHPHERDHREEHEGEEDHLTFERKGLRNAERRERKSQKNDRPDDDGLSAARPGLALFALVGKRRQALYEREAEGAPGRTNAGNDGAQCAQNANDRINKTRPRGANGMIRVSRLHKEKPEGLNDEPQRIQNPRTIKVDLRVEISLAPRNAPEGLPLNGHND